MAPKNPHDSGGRFSLGKEIGHGGLGRVVEAVEKDLERTVAVKLVREDLPPDLAERFIREARLTARLEHPNIVPVHEFATDGNRMMLSMKRVHGRDLGQLLKAVAAGKEPEWTRHRLLGVFQDICQGVAFAHAQGVIHRDLKPANVMIGDFGEVLIVDWGLAKEVGEERGEGRAKKRAPRGTGVAADAATIRPESLVTLDGDVVGTPAYMSPEQAEGRTGDVDERSDVYSLGAILYEMLTFRPPVEGNSVHELLDLTRTGAIEPPSSRIQRAQSASSAPGLPERDLIPRDLDVIVMRALALKREDRIPTAKALLAEVQLFLEGVKTREREHALAVADVVRGEAHRARMTGLRAELARTTAEYYRRRDEMANWDRNRDQLWPIDDRIQELQREIADAFAEADGAVAGALSHERDFPQARRLRAALYVEKFLEAEREGRANDMLIHRRVVERHDDGTHEALLRGDGSLEVEVRAWGCPCLVEGRAVAAAEFARLPLHPFSGRVGEEDRFSPRAYEFADGARVRVHGASCRRDPVRDARVWLFRFEDRGHRLVPVTPEDMPSLADPGGLAAAVEQAWDRRSPFRPQGPGCFVGTGRVRLPRIPMGSYLLVVAADGFRAARVPVVIGRCASWSQQVTLFRDADIPPGMRVVAEGPFGAQGDRETPGCKPPLEPVLGAYFMAIDPVTSREYAEFLNALEAARPGSSAARAPRESGEAATFWKGPPWDGVSLSRGLPEGIESVPDPDWPVIGISWADAMAYCDWKRRQTGFALMLPHSEQFEKAGRGVDRRPFPWGEHFETWWTNVRHSFERRVGPIPVHELVDDESPYGMRGMAGNVRTRCVTPTGFNPRYRGQMGGAWVFAGRQCRLPAITAELTTPTNPFVGFRLVALATLEGAYSTSTS